GDSKADIFWRNGVTGGNRVWVMDGVKLTANTAVAGFSIKYTAVGAGDFDGNLQSDLLFYNPTTGEVLIMQFFDGPVLTSTFTVVGIVSDKTWQIAAPKK